ncbi:MAG: hypothetical protein JO353_10615 [Phycisphaerae bacterium]|nr:hypothetical protein [Phycisphaerae bacterium]
MDVPPCKPSVISDDWVLKGFHLHVHRLELAMRPGHRPGMIVFKRVFSSPSTQDVQAAEEVVRKNCLADPAIRAKWRETIDKAINYLSGYNGELKDLANGRMGELTFLKRALPCLE